MKTLTTYLLAIFIIAFSMIAQSESAYSQQPGCCLYQQLTDESLRCGNADGPELCRAPPGFETTGFFEGDVCNIQTGFCEDPGPVRNVPTLSQWVLIATAGLLGIIGFIVIRRRQFSTNS